MAEHRKSKRDGTVFTTRMLEDDEEIPIRGISARALAGSHVLTPIGGGDAIIVHPDDIDEYPPFDPTTAKPPVEFVVVLKMKDRPQPFVAHIPLEGDDVDRLGKKAAVEVVTDSLTVRDHREIDAVYVTTLDRMEQVSSW